MSNFSPFFFLVQRKKPTFAPAFPWVAGREEECDLLCPCAIDTQFFNIQTKMADLIKIAEEAFATGKIVPEFKAGDTVTVAYRIVAW